MATTPLRLFLVEDDDNISLLIRKHLERAGHEVTTCRTAADALIVLNQQEFDLILLDHNLPDMSGLTLLHTLKEEGLTMPVLLVTGYGDEHLATKAMQAGALDYVAKDLGLNFLEDLPKRVSGSVQRHQLQTTNRLLIEALESTRDGVMITDLHGTILHLNHALEEMMGYDRCEVLGKTPRVFHSGMHPPEFYSQMWRTVMSRRSWQGEFINRRKDGTLLDASITISPILDARGQMTHFVGIYRDIGERKQLERQLLQAQKMQSVGTLAGGVAHEFNNLLAGIQGYAALGVREAGISEETREFMNHIIGLTDRAANLTRQLLAFARKPALTRNPVRIDKLLQSTVDLVSHTLHADVELHLPPRSSKEEPLRALADANQLQQVLINLALNARDAIATRKALEETANSEHGTGNREQRTRERVGAASDHDMLGPNRQEHTDPVSLFLNLSSLTPLSYSSQANATIRFSLQHRLLSGEMPGFPEHVPAGNYVVIEVQDNGVGMSTEILTQAFDPFYTTKGVGLGTGLGLPVAFGIVRAHQGFLIVETSPGVGTCVTVFLPRLVTEMDHPQAFEQAEVLEPEKVVQRRILVIDDEAAVLDVVRRFLEIAGHQVLWVTSGKEACALLQEDTPVDLAILDLMIPREDGVENLRHIQRIRPNLPILLCTGLLQTETLENSPTGKAVRILRKPFRMNELWYAVNQALEDI
ncbi:MAG: response regulator [Gemmataceae bacterium]